jgi:hypothetical protein
MIRLFFVCSLGISCRCSGLFWFFFLAHASVWAPSDCLSLFFCLIFLFFPLTPVIMSEDFEEDNRPNDVDSLLSFEDGEDNLSPSDHEGEEALGVTCNDQISLEDLKAAVTRYASALHFQVTLTQTILRFLLSSTILHFDPNCISIPLHTCRYEGMERVLCAHGQEDPPGYR